MLGRAIGTVCLMMASTIGTAETRPAGALDAADQRFAWMLVNDTVMGGRSSSRFRTDKGQLTFEGLLNTNGGGFASIRSGRQSWDLSGKSAIRLKVRGDGRPYRVRLLVDNDRVSYQHEFATVAGQWRVIELSIDAFYASLRGRRLDRPPLRADEVTGVGFILADRTDGPFSLEVAWVAFVDQTV